VTVADPYRRHFFPRATPFETLSLRIFFPLGTLFVISSLRDRSVPPPLPPDSLVPASCGRSVAFYAAAGLLCRSTVSIVRQAVFSHTPSVGRTPRFRCVSSPFLRLCERGDFRCHTPRSPFFLGDGDGAAVPVVKTAVVGRIFGR